MTDERLDIIETCTRMAVYADQRRWDDLAGIFADRHGRLPGHAPAGQSARRAAVGAGIVAEALETSLLGAWRVTQALLPLLRASPHGRIVNVSSESGSLAGMGSGLPDGGPTGGFYRDGQPVPW